MPFLGIINLSYVILNFVICCLWKTLKFIYRLKGTTKSVLNFLYAIDSIWFFFSTSFLCKDVNPFFLWKWFFHALMTKLIWSWAGYSLYFFLYLEYSFSKIFTLRQQDWCGLGFKYSLWMSTKGWLDINGSETLGYNIRPNGLKSYFQS